MASKNPYSIDDILNEYSSEGVSIIRNSSENEKTSENVPAETEDNGETAGETALSDDIQEENISEYTEPIIPDESDFSSVSDESVSETETEEDIMQESDESADTDEEEYSSRRRSFSYRSTAKSGSRQSRTVRNAEDNIRYLRRDRDIYSGSSDSKTSGKKKSSGFSETKSDISSLENIGSEDSFTAKTNSIREKIKELKNELFGSKSISEKKQNIDLKSVPEVDYFSIDVDINEGSDSSEKSSGFFRKINKSFEKTAENNLDDYNAPGDASLILEDLYSLK